MEVNVRSTRTWEWRIRSPTADTYTYLVHEFRVHIMKETAE